MRQSPGPRIDRNALLKSAAIFALLMAFFLPVLVHRAEDAKRLRIARLNHLATQIAKGFEQRLTSRIGVLEFLVRAIPELDIDDDAAFSRWTQPIHAGISGFYSINFMTADGTIRWVEPLAPNREAIGKRPIDRPDIKPYVERAAATGKSQVTHFVRLFQGPIGFAVYVPVRDRETLMGFVNGAFQVDEFMRLVTPVTETPYAYTVTPLGSSETLVFAAGTPEGEEVGRDEVTIYGQTLRVEVRDGARAPVTRQVDLATTLVFAGALILSFGISGTSYLVLRSRRRLRERLENERFQGTLLNLLVHDILSPLLVIRYSVDAAKRAADEPVARHLEKTSYALDQLHAVITRVRDLRAAHLGKLRLSVTAVPVNELVAEALETLEPRFREKSLACEFEPAPDEPRILVDRPIFLANVMNNVLANAAKFSESGSRVVVRAATRQGQVVIEVEDHGTGMTSDMLSAVLDEAIDLSKPGTRGEGGTGIGMLQIKSYMRFFGGRVTVTSRHRSTHPDTHGTTVCLYIPKAGDGEDEEPSG